jgi:hypothetical protein
MWDDVSALRRIRAAPSVPRIVACGPILDGPQPYVPGAIALANASEAREAVRWLVAEGADFVKVYSLVPRDAYFAIAEETRAAGLPFAGQVHNGITPERRPNRFDQSERALSMVVPQSCSAGRVIRVPLRLRRLMLAPIKARGSLADRGNECAVFNREANTSQIRLSCAGRDSVLQRAPVNLLVDGPR